jgi:hypothetical protein
MIRQLGMHRLDGDLAPDLRLERAVDDAEGAFADALEEPVPSERLASELERRILPQDLLLQPSKFRGGIDPELVGKDPMGRLERGEGITLSSRPVSGEHQVLPESFAQWMVQDERLELAEHSAVPARGELEPDVVLDRAHMQLVQARGLATE